MKNKFIISKLFAIFLLLLLTIVPLATALGNDNDEDFIDDDIDNCPSNSNINQKNTDWVDFNGDGLLNAPEDALGDACDNNMKDPVILTTDKVVDEEELLEFEIVANNGGEQVITPLEITIINNNLPSNAQIVNTNQMQAGKVIAHSKTILFTPTKDQQGVYQLTVQVQDGPIQDGDAVRVVEKTITVTVKDTIKDKPLPKNNAPTADFTWQPAVSEEGQIVQFFATVSDPDSEDSVLLVSWDFNNDGISDVNGFSNDVQALTPNYIFQTAGNYLVKLNVADGFGINGADDKSTTVTKIITVKKKEIQNQENATLDKIGITSFQCLSTVVLANEQICEITVKNLDSNKPLEDAIVVLFFDTQPQKFIGLCNTNSFGRCTVDYIANELGVFTATAVAQKEIAQNINMQTLKKNFTYTVIDHAYDIVNLGIFNSEQNMNLGIEDHEYFRGEGFYIKFQVVDKNDNNQLVLDSDLVAESKLVSQAGGSAVLTEFQKLNDGYFYFRLNAIPLTHNFKGNSNVFAFAFKNNLGGQAKTDLTIFNNPPKIVRNIPDMDVQLNYAFRFDLSKYGFDLEDSGNNLFWEVSGVHDTLFTASVVGKMLVIIPIKEGEDIITLKLTDLDNDYETQDVVVSVSTGVKEKLSLVITADKTEGEVPLDVTFTSTLTNAVGNSIYVWNFGDGSLNSNEANPQHTFSNAGVYTVILSVVDNSGQTASASITITVTEKQLPGITTANLFVFPTEGEAPLLVHVGTSESISDCPIITSSLDFGDGTAIIQNVINTIQTTHVYRNEGIFTITLVVDGGACGKAVATQTITVLHQGELVVSGASARTTFDWSRLSLVSGEEYFQGDTVYVLVDFTNEGLNQLANVEATLDIPELGVHKSIKLQDLFSGQTVVKGILTEIPIDAQSGVYDLRISLDGYTAGQHFHRTKFRQIIVK